MMTTQSSGTTLRELDANRAIRLDNEKCAYCPTVLTPGIRTKDHVIGRRFVPKGKLNGKWNLIINACRGCNGKKAEMENDISAITLAPDPWGRFEHDDPEVLQDATRKGNKAYSQRTKKPVRESQEDFTINVPITPGANLHLI